MSTKIYNGVRVNAGNALANLNLVAALHPGLQELVNIKSAKVHAQRLTEEVDHFCAMRYRLAQGDGTSAPEDWEKKKAIRVWWSVQEEILNRQRDCRQSMRRAPVEDCDVELFLRVDPETGMLLGYLQEERVGAQEFLCRADGIEEYGYWNNSDQPENLSEEEWGQRGKAWAAVLAGDRPCFTVRWEPTFNTMAQIAAHFPSLADRAAARAKRHLQDQAYAQWCQELRARGDEEPKSFAPVARLMRQTDEAMTQEGGALVEPLAYWTAVFQQVLPLDLSECMNLTFGQIPERTPALC